MSFTQTIKDELAKKEYDGGCCYYAELAGILSYAGSVEHIDDDYMLKIITESASVTKRIILSLKCLFGAEFEINIKKYNKGKKLIHSYIIKIKNSKKILASVGLVDGDSIAFRIPYETTMQDCCERAFIRGAFLGSGSIAPPERRYHLEFVTHHYLLSHDFEMLFENFGIKAKTVNRKSKYVTYFKDSDTICDVLAYIGAHNALMQIHNAKILKEIKNQANRVTNFESANIGKMVDASVKQVIAIKKIEKNKGIDSLPLALREIANLRIQNPDITITELGKMLNPSIGKSCVNHRIRRIMEIAKKIIE